MLDDAGIEALRVQHGRVGVVDWEGHQLVFRRPTRDHIRDFRRKQDSPGEKPDSLDQLAQQTLVAYDGLTDGAAARSAFLIFLTECPLFTDSRKFNACMNVLGGLTEVEDAERLGKLVRVFPPPPKRTRTDSESGSDGVPADAAGTSQIAGASQRN